MLIVVYSAAVCISEIAEMRIEGKSYSKNSCSVCSSMGRMETGTGVDKVKPALLLDESDEFDLPEVDQKRKQSGRDNIERRKC
ncbi:hypothetical protein [Bacillus velezensis]|uniref:hypothetical protein n=1 Tax=Bacillus velezensis TaxID=492670 RepID=UPI000744BAEC|nr:hypothetical protein [Bacillus velezensis]AOO62847.1 hypothetical protein BBJ33_15395 [Bacillus velezensis]MCT6831173.1 hypothetical protein [Bacillus velezensis]MCT6864562.1 hypothetical protein [Bacillus velezensis]QGT57128.1 hypothetical protein GL331_00745 [Bacillus velezensis]WKW08109.1 hypothetical protein Q3Y59_15245 [Bacillus velezensis]